MQFKRLLDTLARSSAQAVTTLGQGQKEQNELKNYLYVETKIEKDFRGLLDSNPTPDTVIFLCGSSCSGQLIPDSILRFSSAATGEMPSLNV